AATYFAVGCEIRIQCVTPRSVFVHENFAALSSSRFLQRHDFGTLTQTIEIIRPFLKHPAPLFEKFQARIGGLRLALGCMGELTLQYVHFDFQPLTSQSSPSRTKAMRRVLALKPHLADGLAQSISRQVE